MRSLTRTRTPFSEADLLSIDDRIAKATSEGRATVPLARYDRANNPISGLVDVIASRDHILHRHAGGHQTLMGVAQDEFGHIDFFGHDE